MKLIASLFETLFSPRLERDTPAWYRARLIMAVSGLVLIFYFFPELIGHLLIPLDPVSLTEAMIILVGTSLMLNGFLLARWGHVSLAGWLTVGGWTLDVLLDIALGEGMELGATMQVWLFVGLVMAFLLLTLREYIFFAFFQGLSAWLVAWLRYHSGQDVTASIELHLAFTVMLGLGTWLRENDRRQREQAMEALQKQRAYLQKIMDSIQSPLYVVDARNYRIRLANQAAREMGLVEERTTCYALTHRRAEPCDGIEHPCPLQHVRTKRRPYTTEHIHYRADGSAYYAEVHGYPIFDDNGEVIEMVEYSVDVTERKRAEAEIRKLQQAVEHAASGVIITDPHGVIEYVNPSFEQMTGYRREEVLGKTPRLLKSGKHPPEFYAELWRTIRSGQIWQGELINRRKDGTLYWEFQTIAPILNSEGKITHFVGIKLDITRQKELEQQLLEAKEAAEAASIFKSRLLANVSHDMRTPLGAILGSAELIREEAYGPINEAQRAALNIIIESAHRLANLISGMLTRAELESGRLRLRKRPFAPAELFKALTAHRHMAERKGLSYVEEIDPHMPDLLYGDPYWLEQILINLTDNAIKYTEAGIVRVRLQRIDEAHWGISVQDTGIGIPAEKHEEIFQPFSRLEDTPGKRQEGIGLGLSIVKELTDRLGGRIHLQSTPGKGSTFVVIFPIEEVPHGARSTDHRR